MEVCDCGQRPEVVAGSIEKLPASNVVVTLKVEVEGKKAAQRFLEQDSPVWKSEMSLSTDAGSCLGLDKSFPLTRRGFPSKKLLLFFGTELVRIILFHLEHRRSSPYQMNRCK